jgi:hypothetical protein
MKSLNDSKVEMNVEINGTINFVEEYLKRY